MGVRKRNKALPSRPSLPRRCKEKQQGGSGIYEEKERALKCNLCGKMTLLRDPGCVAYHGELEYLPQEETVELPSNVDIECSICLNSCKFKRMLKLLCDHRFHKKCILKWFQVDIRCPLCRV
ncbi:hypothetical protein AVEN_82879-1 [Araneus ventricosus]|uniref:RING-type domain-containing protein n=1 Tax=Araneus ventricosus TaxID=182803 RepID=A0A4Y2QR29_ARAVE|nr:hypothetical protein AVEN_82879-1 [Araneus ventricosus]